MLGRLCSRVETFGALNGGGILRIALDSLALQLLVETHLLNRDLRL